MIVPRPRLIYVITEDWYFWSHRLDLARAVRDAGFEVTIATRVTDHGQRIREEGFNLVPLKLVRRSRNPLHEYRTVSELVRLYRNVRPHIVHHVALKPILYGSLAAWMTGVPVVVNAFAGLGYVFSDERRKVFQWSMKVALRMLVGLSRSWVLVQNRDDQDRLVSERIVPAGRTSIIAGSGIDTGIFPVSPPPDGNPVVLLPARMLSDKGIEEFVKAARYLKNNHLDARFVLVGRRDEHNPAAISESRLNEWMREGVVEWWGHRDDMPAVYRAASLIVLPSYREGLPKVLLEAAATGRAIVTTDVPGCREVVRHQENGLLVPPKNWKALADGIEQVLNDRPTRERMAARGREVAEKEWAVSRIAGETLALYRTMLGTTVDGRLHEVA